MEQLNKKKVELLNELSSNQAIKVLEIWHPSTPNDKMFFETGDFRQATNETPFHELKRCKDITNVIDEKTSQFVNSPNFVQSVITEIENNMNLTISKKFHKDFIYIWHI